jgi:hypothetical protein
LSFTGCGGGDDNNSSGPVAEVSLYSATPTITGDITFNYSNAEYVDSKGWRTMAQGGYMYFVFSGSHGFKFNAGATKRSNGDLGSVNVSVNGNTYWSNKSIAYEWTDYIIPASAFGDGENTVKIEQANDLSVGIDKASIGDGSDYELATSSHNSTSVDCSFYVEPGGLGFASGDAGGTIESLATITISGNTINITPGSNKSAITGTLVGSGTHTYNDGSYIKWLNTPTAGQDLAGSFVFVLDNGTYEGTITVPGNDVKSSSDIHSDSGSTLTIWKD